MIERYTRPEMGKIWSAEARFQAMLEVEIAVAEAQGSLRIIPRAAAATIRKKARFRLERIQELESVTRHDVIAFVSSVAESVGEMGRFVHFGLTSSDVLDTALSLQIHRAEKVLAKAVERWWKALEKLARRHAADLCAGRTHGMHAEPTTFGLKLLGFLAELSRVQVSLREAFQDLRIVKLSGAVGTYSTSPEAVESKVARAFGFRPEPVATQVVPRDRHAALMFALARLGAALERLSLELRHLQRTEVAEVSEGFRRGQKGSSAMPHKKNPISAENLTGVSRLLRSYVGPALENIALWHERDISHSSVERVILGDALILAHYGSERMAELLEELEVFPARMRENLALSRGTLLSSQLLLAVVAKGISREEAYAKVQALSHGLGASQTLEKAALSDPFFIKTLGAARIKQVFKGDALKKALSQRVKRQLIELKRAGGSRREKSGR